MKDLHLREKIITFARRCNETGLSAGTSGNLSARIEDFYLITPSGIPYHELDPGDIVKMDTDGRVLSGQKQPSSEWRFHRDIYLHRSGINGVVHVHSPYATALACARRMIPAFHYMVAIAGGNSVRCAEYATFGTEELSRNALAALAGRQACLLANHGMIAIGTNLDAAFNMAQQVEELARQYHLALQIGDPVLLDDAEMQINLEKFRHYGRQDEQ